MSRPNRRRLLGPGINLAPMMDAILNLVFFFLLATTLKRQEAAMQVSLPAARSGASAEGAARPTLFVDAAGGVLFEGELLAEEGIEPRMRDLVAEGVSEVDIRGDESADFGRIVRLMDRCKLAGMKAANIHVRREGSGADPATVSPASPPGGADR